MDFEVKLATDGRNQKNTSIFHLEISIPDVHESLEFNG